MKKVSIFIAILVILTLSHYFYRAYSSEQRLEFSVEIGGISWPAGTIYKDHGDGILELELADEMDFSEGSWPAGTKIHFENNKIEGIEVFEPFEFAQFKFLQQAKIAFIEGQEKIEHVIELSAPKKIDGVELASGCLVHFKDFVLFRTKCPEEDYLFYKRKISLPEVNLQEGR